MNIVQNSAQFIVLKNGAAIHLLTRFWLS